MTDTPEQTPEEQAEAALIEAWGAGAKLPDFPAYKKLLTENFALSEQTRFAGGGLNDASVIYERIESLIEFLMPVGTQDRLELEIKWQKKIKKSLNIALANALAARQQQQIAVPQQASRLIIPGR